MKWLRPVVVVAAVAEVLQQLYLVEPLAEV